CHVDPYRTHEVIHLLLEHKTLVIRDNGNNHKTSNTRIAGTLSSQGAAVSSPPPQKSGLETAHPCYSRAVQFRQLAPDLTFAFGQFLRHVDLHIDVEVAALS